MSADHDRKFFDMFMIVLGILVGLAVGIYGLAQVVADRTQHQFVTEDAAFQALIAERLRPVGQVAIAGQDNSALPVRGPIMTTAAAPAPAASGPMSGEEVYAAACSACHAAGIAGAPKLGDPAVWSGRIAQGMDTLATHAIDGYQGAGGYMPPKGGRPDLSDDDVRSAIQHMVDASQ